MAPLDRLRYRAPGPACAVRYHPGEAGVRRVALLRLWDAGHRLRFLADPGIPAGALGVGLDGREPALDRAGTGAALSQALPGLWWLRPVVRVPGLGQPAGRLALRLTAQS